jgi:hypothetical protein
MIVIALFGVAFVWIIIRFVDPDKRRGQFDSGVGSRCNTQLAP